MKILKKDSNKMEVEIEINEYNENFNSELIWKDEVDIEIDNILNDYNSVKALMAKTKEFKWTNKE